MANSSSPSGSGTQVGGKVSTASPDLGHDANALMEEARTAAGKVADEARHQAEGVADRARGEVDAAAKKARSMADGQKDLLAEQVGGVAHAIDKAAEELEETSGPTAHYARTIADSAEKLSSTIREKSIDDLLGMAQDFGRRQPALFMGAAALLGFAASRFATASAKRHAPAAPPSPSANNGTQYGASNGSSTGVSQ